MVFYAFVILYLCFPSSIIDYANYPVLSSHATMVYKVSHGFKRFFTALTGLFTFFVKKQAYEVFNPHPHNHGE